MSDGGGSQPTVIGPATSDVGRAVPIARSAESQGQSPNDQRQVETLVQLLEILGAPVHLRSALFRPLRHRFVLAVVALSALLLTGVSSARATDGRAVTPAGELNALYVHFLDRQPDGGGWSNYTNGGLGINSDCRSGMLRATYSLATSPEAADRWRTPENLMGAIYAGMLDRAPDPDGFQHYSDMIHGQGMGAAVMDVMASAEYRNRMDRFCARHSTTNATVLSPSDSSGIAHGLIGVAAVTAKACGAAKLSSAIFKLRGVPPPAIAINAAAKVALHFAGAKACKATYTLLVAAYYGQQLAEAGHYVYWMTQQWDTKSHWWSPTVTHVIVRVGSDPVDGVRYYQAEFNS